MNILKNTCDIQDVLNKLKTDHDLYNVFRDISKLYIVECNALNGIDILTHKAEWKQFLNGRIIASLPIEETDQALKLDEPITQYNRHLMNKKNYFCHMNALYFALLELKIDQVFELLQDINWKAKSDIIAKFLWITEQQKEIEKGENLNLPYMCQVGPPENRQTIDREFYSVIRFFDIYNIQNTTKYFLYQKLEPKNKNKAPKNPDFKAISDDGDELYIEVTEAIDKITAIQNKNFSNFKQKLEIAFKHFNYSISTIQIPDPQILDSNYNAISKWLLSILQKLDAGTIQPKPFYTKKDMGLIIQINKSNGFWLFEHLHLSSDVKFINQTENACKVITERVSDKYEKNYIGNPILLIYLNTVFWDIQLEKVRSLCLTKIKSEELARFKDIWIITDRKWASLKNDPKQKV